MSAKQGIWLDGERELFLNMQKTLDGSIKAGMRGLEKAAMNIIADAKENLRGNESVVTGQLRASGRVQRAQDDDQALDAGFASTHAFYVEYGRRSGKMPPPELLVEWLRKKNLGNKALTSAINILNGKRRTRKNAYTRGDLLLSAAWGLAKHIAKKGTKPHPFFGPAVEKNQKAVSDAITAEIQNAIK
jgi:hypothetical protein